MWDFFKYCVMTGNGGGLAFTVLGVSFFTACGIAALASALRSRRRR